MYCVYVIQNKKDKIYIGQTADLEKRLLRHNGFLGAKAKSYTRINKSPWRIVYQEQFNTRRDAIKRERELKSSRGRDFIRKKVMGP